MSNGIRTASVTSIMNITSNKGSDLTYKDLKIACVVRGMPPEEVLKRDFFGLANWLTKNVLLPENLELLEVFDNYMEDELIKLGKEELIHNSLRLGYVNRPEGDEVIKAPKVVKEKKAPKEKDSNGFFKGTKKSYTYELQGKGKTLEQTITKVKRKFPEAQDKSIRIWYNKAKKGN